MSDDEPDLRSLMASIGFLLLDWSLLEKRLQGATVPDTLDHVRQMRNVICHGLEAAFAAPGDGSRPLVRCRRADGSLVDYTHDELTKATQALRSVSHRWEPGS